MEIVGWTGNIFILAAIVLLGRKKRSGWVFSALGNILWTTYAMWLTVWSMAAIDGLMMVLAIYNWTQWND